MPTEEIKSFIYTMARSQGFYGRLARDIEETPDGWELFRKECEKHGCKGTLDVVFMLEG